MTSEDPLEALLRDDAFDELMLAHCAPVLSRRRRLRAALAAVLACGLLAIAFFGGRASVHMGPSSSSSPEPTISAASSPDPKELLRSTGQRTAKEVAEAHREAGDLQLVAGDYVLATQSYRRAIELGIPSDVQPEDSWLLASLKLQP